MTEAHLADFRRLREALRSLFGAVVSGEPGDPQAVALLNECAARAPHWPVLSSADGGYAVAERTVAGPGDEALAAIASDGAHVLASAPPSRLCRCAAAGCVQFFLADHPGRRWCSPGCGNRARAARHYRRHGRDRAG